jgi:hypothetical protein
MHALDKLVACKADPGESAMMRDRRLAHPAKGLPDETLATALHPLFKRVATAGIIGIGLILNQSAGTESVQPNPPPNEMPLAHTPTATADWPDTAWMGASSCLMTD